MGSRIGGELEKTTHRINIESGDIASDNMTARLKRHIIEPIVILVKRHNNDKKEKGNREQV